MTQQERIAMFRSFLADEGYAPTMDDCRIIFGHEGGSYAIIVVEDDDEFFRLMYWDFWSTEDEAEHAKAVEAAAYATAKTKVAKVYPLSIENVHHMCAFFEMFCVPPDAFKNVFRRSLSVLQTAAENFREGMQ